MSTHQAIQQYRQKILALAARYGARDIRVFGSAARGHDAPGDLDLLVNFDPDRSLLDHGGLVADLEELLGIKVDVLSEKGLSPRFRDRVLKEAVPL